MAVAARLKDAMWQSVLSFPLTSFTDDGAVDLQGFRDHVRRQVAAGPAAIFPCCGTGEFFPLDEEEYEALVIVAVEETDRRVPVVTGLGYGWAQAARFAKIAERAGADGALLKPHYLVNAPQDGLVQQVREVAQRTALPLIVYQRGQVKFSSRSIAVLAEVPGVIGLKDGHSDLDQLQRARLAAPDHWLFFNGAATAELQARAYRAVGVPAYSSAVHSFAPEIASAFFRAFHDGDEAVVDALLSGFYWPLVELRDRQPGYAVALVKAAARLGGERVGPVRAPLNDPSPTELADLEAVLAAGLALVGADK
jgi:5-dehydro-4-deoxyglucarate dehydratase